ncbi:hypothetical protein SAMN05660297_03206 [Natronincola peptidivorans]|uniref:Uncharacterized protein n=1 Tax=Natronincola peptidivorans TaxID=426128 RepID=A0A1I0GH53_9FIRM|nr:hypothetical protein [Natronincola peptidivorans]SET70346.1 hypothetical protein SAMN05660297_03206 [Natronincola peptidivorans]
MKKFFIIFICLLVIVTGAGIWGYQYFFGIDDNLRTQLEEEFSEEFFSFNDLDLKDSPLIESTSTSAGSVGFSGGNNISVDYISDKYAGKFDELETVVKTRIDVLIQRAYEEYMNQQTPNQLNDALLARKYLQAASMLEASVEATLDSLLREMELELQSHQLPTDLVDETKEYYQQMIQGIKSNALDLLKTGVAIF